MLKSRPLFAAFSAAALFVFPQIADSRPLSKTYGYPVVSNSQELNSLTCYIQTQDGATLNLGRLCGKVAPTTNTANAPTTNTADLDSSKSLSDKSTGLGGKLSATDDVFNCSDFATQATAQRVLEAVPGDPNRLDGNGDGVACEWLP